MDGVRLEHALQHIRGEIEKVGAAANEVYSAVALTEKLKGDLVSFQNYPAHYLLLQAVLQTGSSSEKDLAKAQEKYRFPEGWRGGLQHLISTGILEGT